jgi:hypothetical protein
MLKSILLIITAGVISLIFAQMPASRIKQLSKNADVILAGKVTEKKSAWNKNKTRIYTHTTLQVSEYLKGKANETSVEITYPGGEVGEVGELYTHMPRFEENEEVVVFLAKDKKNKGYKLVDGDEGKIRISINAKGKESVSKSSLSLQDIKKEITNSLIEK